MGVAMARRREDMPASSVSLSAAEVAEMRRLRRLAGDSDLDTVKALRATVNRLQGNLTAPGYLFLIAHGLTTSTANSSNLPGDKWEPVPKRVNAAFECGEGIGRFQGLAETELIGEL